MDSLPAVQTELRHHNDRLEANHNSLANLRDRVAGQEVRIKVMETELRETREDLAGMMRDFGERFTRLEKKMDAELSWIRRGAWAIAFGFASLSLAAAPVAVQLLTS